MRTSDYKGVKASSLSVSESYLDVTLEDGRMLRIPTALFPKLRDATPDQRANWEWIGRGIGIEWPDLDEFLSIAGFLRNTPYFVPPIRSIRSQMKPRPSSRSTARKKVAA
jgi:hypothetical protein